MYLTQDSPRATQTHGSVPLKDHQLAMLYKCIEIEKVGKPVSLDKQKQKIGIMRDTPGSGKTYVVLSLIMMSPKDSINVIVVPENIYTQWEQAIQHFCGQDAEYARFVTYADVSSLYYRSSSIRTNIVLTTPLYFNVIVDSLQGNCSQIERVFIDEIDSVSRMLRYNDVFGMLWFVSASFKPSSLKSLRFNEHDIDQEGSLDDLTCCCNESFVKLCFSLPEPIQHTVICRNTLLDHVLYGLVSEEQYRMFNALDYTAIQMMNTVHVANNIQEVVSLFVKDLVQTVERHEETLQDIEKQITSLMLKDDDTIAGEINVLMAMKPPLILLKQEVQQKIDCIRQRVEVCEICNICYSDIDNKVVLTCCQNSFCEACITAWCETRNKRGKPSSCPICRHDSVNLVKVEKEPILEQSQSQTETDIIVTDDSSSKTKMELLEEMFTTSQLGEKVIIFADYTSIFKEISKLLERLQIEHVELDGGTIKAIDESVQRYKQGNVKVMMTNSSLYGCGMNLENTTDVVLLHKVNPVMTEQIIGRAQRPGRMQVLNVWHLWHENEVDQVVVGV